MRYLKITLVGLVCTLATTVMANHGNVARDVDPNARSNVGDYLKARQDYEAFIAEKYPLSARGVGPVAPAVTVTVTTIPDYCIPATKGPAAPAGEVVTVTVTGTPDSCVPATVPVVIETTPTPTISSVYTPPEFIPSTPAKVKTPFVPGTGIPASPSLPTSPNVPGTAIPSVTTPFVGVNTTVSTSSLTGTKSTPASKVPSHSSSVPATSSTPVPTGAASKSTSMSGVWLTILLAISGNTVFLL